MSITALKVSEAQKQLAILIPKRDNLRKIFGQISTQIANLLSSRVTDINLQRARNNQRNLLQIGLENLRRELGLLDILITELKLFTSLDAEAERARRLVAAATKAAELAQFSQREKRELTNESLRILALAERAKKETLNSGDAIRLAEQLRIEQAKAQDILQGILNAASQERARKEKERRIQEENTEAFRRGLDQQEIDKRLAKQRIEIKRISEIFGEGVGKLALDEIIEIARKQREELDKEVLEEEGAQKRAQSVFRDEDSFNLGGLISLLSDGTIDIDRAPGRREQFNTRGLEKVWRETSDVQTNDLIDAYFIQREAADIIGEIETTRLKK